MPSLQTFLTQHQCLKHLEIADCQPFGLETFHLFSTIAENCPQMERLVIVDCWSAAARDNSQPFYGIERLAKIARTHDLYVEERSTPELLWLQWTKG